MDIIQRIEDIIAAPLLEVGYGIVRIQLSGNIRRTLQIMIERADNQPICVEDCAKVSRLVAVRLDVEDTLNSAYVLEVSSPGLDRPLVKVRDYQRFVGHEVVVKTIQSIGNRKTFQGKLESATETAITVLLSNMENTVESEEALLINIPYGEIRSAYLYVAL